MDPPDECPREKGTAAPIRRTKAQAVEEVRGPTQRRRKLARKQHAQAQVDPEPQVAPHVAREPEGMPDPDPEWEELDEANFAKVEDEAKFAKINEKS
ncbi:hypothetical protein P8452_11683 [Trifolium repens]|nr:hypothetical protein P8452_11683 [Trifolium repens]